MDLVKPALTQAEPGLPVTAQAWNEIIDGLDDLYDAVLAMGSAEVTVDVTFGDAPVGTATVVAESVAGEAPSVAAVPPIGPRTGYLLTGLTPGEWRVRVEATGLAPQSPTITVPRTEPLVVAMEAAGPVVDDLFGLATQVALNVLDADGIGNDRVRIIDTSGQEISPHDVPPEHQNSEVLVQSPQPGGVLVSADQGVRLVIAAPLAQVESVTMPSLIGLTYDELVEVLTNIGLKVGTTTVKSGGS